DGRRGDVGRAGVVVGERGGEDRGLRRRGHRLERQRVEVGDEERAAGGAGERGEARLDGGERGADAGGAAQVSRRGVQVVAGDAVVGQRAGHVERERAGGDRHGADLEAGQVVGVGVGG